MSSFLQDIRFAARMLLKSPGYSALAAIVLGRDRRLLPASAAVVTRARAWLAAPVVLYALYVVVGAVARLLFLYEVGPGVRVSAALASAAGLAIYATWPRVPAWMGRYQWSHAASLGLVFLFVASDLAQYGQWAAARSYKNYEASREIGGLLPAGTLVQGKLANGLALENGIRPLFIGPGFGNYHDRLSRDGVRYVLTYVAPRLGYEGAVIQDVLEASPGWRIVRQFEVTETPGGGDRAALIDKMGTRPGSAADRGGGSRARD